MSDICGECGGKTIWDEDAASSICSTCGTLTDPSQSILTSHIDRPQSPRQNGLYSAGSTLKSFRRTRQGWDLAGQGKEARDNRNAYAIHDFVRNLSAALSVPGLSPRAINLFTQAMATGQFRWGRKARCLVGVCLAIALRESNRPDAIRDIASILEEPPSILSRTFMSVVALLHLNLNLADPALHIPSLEARLNSVIQASNLSSALVEKLSVLHIPSVMRTVQSLSNVVYRLGEGSEVTTLPSGPTAAALLLLALEAESRTSLPNIGELAQNLAPGLNVQGSVVMARYKLIQDLVADCIQRLPWVDKSTHVKARAKVAKRTLVARSLQDVIQFQEDLWVQRFEDVKSSPLNLEDHTGLGQEPSIASTSTADQPSIDAASGPPRKKRRTNRSLEEAHQFILDPISHRLPSVGSQTSIDNEELRPITSSPQIPHPPATPERPSLMNYVLTVSPSANRTRYPTRLQILATASGGEVNIPDDELITEAEWSLMLRSEPEKQQLQAMWEEGTLSEQGNEDTQDMACFDRNGSKGKQFRHSQDTTVVPGRINMDAYAKAMRSLDIVDEASESTNFLHRRSPETSNDEWEGEVVDPDDAASFLRKTVEYSIVYPTRSGTTKLIHHELHFTTLVAR